MAPWPRRVSDSTSERRMAFLGREAARASAGRVRAKSVEGIMMGGRACG